MNSNPNLLSDIVRCHSPLHLAAKNGHKHVVKVLLDSGFDINYMVCISIFESDIFSSSIIKIACAVKFFYLYEIFILIIMDIVSLDQLPFFLVIFKTRCVI